MRFALRCLFDGRPETFFWVFVRRGSSDDGQYQRGHSLRRSDEVTCAMFFLTRLARTAVGIRCDVRETVCPIVSGGRDHFDRAEGALFPIYPPTRFDFFHSLVALFSRRVSPLLPGRPRPPVRPAQSAYLCYIPRFPEDSDVPLRFMTAVRWR
jgi:hypothetical protein